MHLSAHVNSQTEIPITAKVDACCLSMLSKKNCPALFHHIRFSTVGCCHFCWQSTQQWILEKSSNAISSMQILGWTYRIYVEHIVPYNYFSFMLYSLSMFESIYLKSGFPNKATVYSYIDPKSFFRPPLWRWSTRPRQTFQGGRTRDNWLHCSLFQLPSAMVFVGKHGRVPWVNKRSVQCISKMSDWLIFYDLT